MAKQFTTVYKPEEIPAAARPLPSRIRIKGVSYSQTEIVKDAADYAGWLYRMRLTCELHNRDAGPTDLWEIQEERVVGAPV